MWGGKTFLYRLQCRYDLLMRLLVACVFLVAGCGGGGGDGNRTDPVPSTPLAGMLNGTPWTAVSARAKNSSTAGEKSIRIYPNTVTCAQIGAEPYVVVGTAWVPGNVEVDLESDSVIFIFMDATAHVVLDGRIELPSAPTDVGAKVMMGLRASFEDGDDDLFVEGQVEVEICE